MVKNIFLNVKVWCFLAAAVLLFGILSACGEKTQTAAAKRPEIKGVTVSYISLSTVDDISEVTGTVRSDRVSVVASRVMGVVTSVPVREGDAVKAGQLLATIDERVAAQQARAADMALESARQNTELASRTWQRHKNLYEEKALSRQEMDQIETQKKVAQAEYERAKAMVEETRTHLSFTRVTAPAAGTVIRKHIDAGSMASPGAPLVTIESGGSPYIEASLDAAWEGKVKPGQAVEAVIETQAKPLRGVIREVISAVDPQSRTFTVKVSLKDAQPRSGLFARLKIPAGKKEAIRVPNQALVYKGQLTGVYAVDRQGVVTYRLVRAGLSFAGMTEILSGLMPGDRVVTNGVDRVIDGGILTGEQAP